MKCNDTLFQNLLKALPQKKFHSFVENHKGDKWTKKLRCWDILINLLHGQLTGEMSLRRLEASQWCYQKHLKQLGTKSFSRSTLAEACRQRPAKVFEETFSFVLSLAKHQLPSSARKALYLIDSTPIQLRGPGFDWVKSNSWIAGLKAHVVYASKIKLPCSVTLTSANVNDVTIGKRVKLEPGATYCFDKAYFDYHWWKTLHDQKYVFVTRVKKNVRVKKIHENLIMDPNIKRDWIVQFTSTLSKKCAIPIRYIEVKMPDRKHLTLISNDINSDAKKIAEIYRQRWQIELLFKWLKSHLKIKHFISKNENGIKIQIMVAMIAFLLIRLFKVKTKLPINLMYLKIFINRHLYQPACIWRVDKIPISSSTSSEKIT